MPTTPEQHLTLVPRNTATLTLTPRGIAEAELEWLFNMSDIDMGDHTNYFEMLIPIRHHDQHTDSPERRADAARVRRIILDWLRVVEAHTKGGAGVLEATFRIAPWPLTLRAWLRRATGVAVRLAAAEHGLPDDDRELALLERATAERLADDLDQHGAPGLETLRAEAIARYTAAFSAYERARRDAPSALVRLK